MVTQTALEGAALERTSLVARVGIGAICLFAANISLLLVFYAFELSLFRLAVVYWWECVWVGLFSALKLLVASILGDPWQNRFANVSRGAGIFLSLLVIWVVGGVFLGLFGFAGLLLFSPFFDQLEQIQAHEIFRSSQGVFGAALVLLASHGVSFIVHFLLGGEFKKASMLALVVLPFKRNLATVACIGVAVTCSLATPALATSSAFAAVLLIAKIIGDYALHRAERNSLQALKVPT